MKLYHGTNTDIEVIDLSRGLRHKDFGKRFYATPDRTTAVRMVQKRARLLGGKATLLLQDKYLDQQYYFGTDKALHFLHKKNVETV